jgi:hypothetical protein
MLRFICIFILFLISFQTNANQCTTNNGLPHYQTEQEDGVGGTGYQGGGDGIGGTGHENDSGDGIGGTGYLNDSGDGIGGTGIVGIVTGFASICINGVEVDYDQQTSVDVDGETASTSALRKGQLVAINTTNKDGRLQAKHISISHPLIGKIEKISPAKDSLQVMGQMIRINSNTIGKDKLKPNQTVALSGLVSEKGVIHATRIDIEKKSTPSSITGLVDQSGKINGVAIAMGEQIKANKQLQVSGSWNGRSLIPSQINESPIQRVISDAKKVIIQGISPVSTKGKMNVQHQPFKTTADTKTKAHASIKAQVVIVRGTKNEKGEINAKTIEYLEPDNILKHGGGRPTPQGIDLEHHKTKKSNAVIEKIEKTSKHESDNKGKHEKPEKIEHEKPEKIEHEKPEKIEYEKPEKIEYEKPEKIEYEKPEKIEYEKPEKIEYEKHED